MDNINLPAFHESLRRLQLQLEEMNGRTPPIFLPGSQGQKVPPSVFDTQVPSQSLYLPSGPAFWQLYRSLRTDLRGVEARVELVEDRIEDICSRLEALEPLQATPPSTPTIIAAKPTAVSNDTNHSCSRGVTIPETTRNAIPQIATIAELADIGIFDPTLNENDHDDHATSDAITFIARLKRVSSKHRIVRVERFLRGSALHLYTIGYDSNGTNTYDLEGGDFNVDAFGNDLLALFRPKALRALLAERYTLTDLRNGRCVVRDYALKMLSLGRYLDECDAAKKVRLTYALILRGIQLDVTSATLDTLNTLEEGIQLPDDLPTFLTRLSTLESALKQSIKEQQTT